MKYLIKISVLLLFIFTSFIQNENIYNLEKLKDKLFGKWIYQYSWVANKKVYLEKNNLKPVYSMEFLKCDDNIELKMFPKIVRNIRKKDVLKNVKCIMRRSDGRKFIEFPTLLRTVNNSYLLKYYGRKHKDYYSIDSLSKGKMVIRGYKTFHVYKKITKSNN